MDSPANLPTREVFGNIAPWMRVLFYGLMATSVAILGFRVRARWNLWRQGTPGGFEKDWRLWLRRFSIYAVGQKRVHRKSLGAALHLCLFMGFVVLTIGTTLLMIADVGPVNFHVGWYYLFYELTMDLFGVAFCVGCGLALYRRLARKPASLGHNFTDWYLLALLLSLGLTGFALEALRLHYTEVPQEIARWSITGWAIDRALLSGLSIETTRSFHLGMWWLHSVLIALFFATLPITRFLHVLVAPINIAARPERPMGAMATLHFEEVEQTGRTGVGAIEHFNRQQLLSLDACMECGRCEDACPAWASGKPLSPKKLVVDLRKSMASAPSLRKPLHGDTVAAETLWACTMCQACVQTCPVLIGHVDLVSDLRRFLVGEGQFSGTLANSIKQVANRSNPYGRPNSERLDWAEGLDVPTVDSNPGFEYLFWVGCSASFDPRAQKVARSFVQLLSEAKVNFAVLGKKECCTGDPARRAGDEFLFQDLAQKNVSTLNAHKVRKIVTGCPHCFNTLGNEYPGFDGHYEVQHHSQLLAELLASGRLKSAPGSDVPVTFHDPCYLARANQETAAPRQVLSASSSNIREMTRHGKNTFCCGAGGGRMWSEEAPNQRVSKIRAEEAGRTGAKTVATGCPFCLNMMSDAMTDGSQSKGIRVMDIAEILLEGKNGGAPLSNRRENDRAIRRE